MVVLLGVIDGAGPVMTREVKLYILDIISSKKSANVASGFVDAVALGWLLPFVA